MAGLVLEFARSVRHRLAVALRKRGITVSRKPTLTQFLHSRGVDLVVDVGANVGQFARELREEGYVGRILSLEPISTVHEELATVARGDPLWTTRQTAVGSAPGTATINIAAATTFSSIRSTSAFGKAFHEGIATVATEQVPVIRLDDLPELQDDNRLRRSFIKIDTQGFEEEVLAGAARVLALCAGVQMELPVNHLYEGVWTMETALRFMRERGLAAAQIRPVVFHEDRVSAIEFDFVFRRND